MEKGCPGQLVTQKRGQLIPAGETAHATPEAFLDKISKSETGQSELWEKEETVEVQKDHSLVCWETLEVGYAQSNFSSPREMKFLSTQAKYTILC